MRHAKRQAVEAVPSRQCEHSQESLAPQRSPAPPAPSLGEDGSSGRNMERSGRQRAAPERTETICVEV